MKPRDLVNLAVYAYAGAVTMFCAAMLLCDTRQALNATQQNVSAYVVDAGDFTAQHDSAWRRTRDQFYATHQVCAMCGTDKDVQVHHVLPWHLYPELRHTYTNLISLCQPCHFRFGHGRDWKAYNPDISNLAKAAQTSLSNVVTRQQHDNRGAE